MIAPNSYQAQCQKCGYKTIFNPKSDVVNLQDDICQKCKKGFMVHIEKGKSTNLITSIIKKIIGKC